MATFTVGECVRFGWETFKRRPGILIAALIITYAAPILATSLVGSVLGAIFNAIGAGVGEFIGLALMLAFVVTAFVLALLGLFTFYLRAHDNIDGVTIGDMWNPEPFWRFFGAELLLLLMVFVGCFLFVVPGIIAALGFAFAPVLTIDRGLGPIEALKTSWRITKGHKGTMFLLLLALTGINILGTLALLIGVLVSIPVVSLALIHAYRTLSPRA